MMKNIKKIVVLLLAVGTAGMFQACSDDEASSASFEQVYAEYDESAGAGSVTIPIRGSKGGVEYVLSGTAEEGVDYTFSETAEGIQINVLDNDTYSEFEGFEPNESVIVRMEGAGAGNTRFELTIFSDCDYEATDFDAAEYAGEWSVIEDYGGGALYGPYHVTLVQDGTNANRFDFDNFYDSGYDAYIVLNGPNGTVSFPDQNAGGDASSPAITASTGTFDRCTQTMTINLTYDGGPWVYRFSRD
jgi:hypothetical protein